MLPSSSSASPTMATIRPAARSVGHQPVQADSSPGSARRTGSWRHPGRPSRSRSRRRTCPWCATGRTGPRPGRGTLQLLDRLAAEQVHGGVVDRARMRLDRDPVAGPQHVEVERGHDAGDRGAGRLVAADLQLVARWGGDGWRGGWSSSPARAASARSPAAAPGGPRPHLGARRHRSSCPVMPDLRSRAAWSVAHGDAKGPRLRSREAGNDGEASASRRARACRSRAEAAATAAELAAAVREATARPRRSAASPRRSCVALEAGRRRRGRGSERGRAPRPGAWPSSPRASAPAR